MKKWKQLTGTDRILYALSVLLVAAILWYWQTGTDNGTLNKVLLSSPENVLKSFTQLWGKGSLQRVHGFVAQQCRYNPVGTILIDGGDILQGEPTSYYFNFVAKRKHHRVADFCNFIGYDVSVMGNHDFDGAFSAFHSLVWHWRNFKNHCDRFCFFLADFSEYRGGSATGGQKTA